MTGLFVNILGQVLGWWVRITVLLFNCIVVRINKTYIFNMAKFIANTNTLCIDKNALKQDILYG